MLKRVFVWILAAEHRLRAVLTLLRSRRGASIALMALIAAHLLLNVLWLRLDEHVIRIDEEFHVSAAQEYLYAAKDPALSGLWERLQAFAEIESPYPPMLHVVGAATAFALGYSVDTIAFSASICFALVIWGTYRVARRVYARPAALFAAAVTSLIPILYGGSRYVALENLMAVFSVWGMFFLMTSGGFRRWRYVVLFSMANGAAILTKPNAFVYYLLPAAVVYFAGLWTTARASGGRGVAAHVARGMACVAITLAIAAPWYLYHRASLEDYWMSEHKGGKTPFTFTRNETPKEEEGPRQLLEDRIKNPAQHLAMQDSAKQDSAMRAPVASAVHNTAEIPAAAPPPAPLAPAASPPPAVATSATPTVTASATPAQESNWHLDLADMIAKREWSAYPIMLINNGLFFPLAVLGLVGLLVGTVRFWRSPDFWLIVLWLVGSYVLNTLLFRYINPRYMMPFLAVVGICVAGLPHALPGRRVRAVFAAAVLGLLTLQYANISFVGYEGVNSWIPVLKDRFRVTYFQDKGLTLTKAEVITGTYCFRAPQLEENYVHRGFRAIIENERAKGREPGRTVNYITIARQNNFGGFRNLETCYWPEPNPLLLGELRGHPERQYRLTRTLRCNVGPEAKEAIVDADYVIATLDETDATTDLGPRHVFFDEIRDLAPMDMIDFFYAPSYGKLPPAMIGVFSKGKVNRYDEVLDYRGREAMVSQDALFQNAIRLIGMRGRAGEEGGLTPEQLADCDSRLTSLAPHLRGALQISPNLDLVNMYFDQPFSGWYRLRVLFKVNEQPKDDWRIFVTGSFSQEVARRVPPEIRAQKFFSWNFNPDRPTSTWLPGEIVLCTREFHCPPVPLTNISIGFFRNGSEGWGKSVSTGPIDLSVLPVNEGAVIRD